MDGERVNIFKAQQVFKDKPVESKIIVIDREIPDVKTLEEARQVYQKEAKELADLLCHTLPGGTLDQLICELLSRRASLFIAPMFKKEETK